MGGGMHLDMFTAASWINVLLGAVNFVMFLPFVFKEKRIAAREAMLKQGAESEAERLPLERGKVFQEANQNSDKGCASIFHLLC